MSEKEKDKEKQINDEEITKEELIQLLKAKSKELKQTSVKLTKLETKYVQVFKDQKKYTKDRENIMQFLVTVFSSEQGEEYQKVGKTALGDLDSKNLQELFFKRESNKEQAMNKIMEDFNKEKSTMEETYKSKLQDQVLNLDQDNQNIVNSLQDQIEEVENNNEKLAKEIIELNQIIQQKTDQINSMQQQEDQTQKMQTQKLISELQIHKQNTSDSQNIQKRILESQYQDQILTLRNELEQANEKIHTLEDQQKKKPAPAQALSPQLQSLNQSQAVQSQAKKKVHQSSSETQTDSIYDPITGQFVDRQNYEKDQFNKQFGLQIPEQNQTPSNKNKQNINFSNSPKTISFQPQQQQQNYQFSSNHQEEDTDGLTTEQKLKQKEEYLKNVLLKYFEYSESRQHKEAQLLQSSIMTILKMSPQERNKIEIARSKGSLWNATLSYIPFVKKNAQNSNTQQTHSEVLQTQ